MELDEIKNLILKVSRMTDHFEERGNKIVQTTLQASQHMTQTTQSVASNAERITNKALESFKAVAGEVLTKSLDESLKVCNNQLLANANQFVAMSDMLERRIWQMQKIHVANAWKAFIACAIASFAVIGVAIYSFISSQQEIERKDWVSAINVAAKNGKLTTCADGGICANVNNKLVRLDK